ncbi:hypothetical protein quinque_014631 [Culex quinquefasciatus]
MTSLLPRLCRIPCNPSVARLFPSRPLSVQSTQTACSGNGPQGWLQQQINPHLPVATATDGLRELRQEFALSRAGMARELASDALVVFRPGETDVVFNFERQEQLDRWL